MHKVNVIVYQTKYRISKVTLKEKI